jgi:RHS repeat-associated protein
MDSVLGVSAEKPGADYRSFVRDNTGALVGLRNPQGSPVVKKRYYYLRDALGSVVAVTNDQGAVVRRHVYGDPYGEDVSDDVIVSGAPSNPYRFAGEYFDAETGLYKIGERYYDAALARWTQKDPMMQAFSPREANGYAYAGGDPVNITDPTGRQWWAPWVRAIDRFVDEPPEFLRVDPGDDEDDDYSCGITMPKDCEPSDFLG